MSQDHSLGARTSDPLTSHESAERSGELRGKIAEAILALALKAGTEGITINEATAALPDFKPVSVSPVFAPLIRSGQLVRIVIGRLEPSRKWPHGKEIFQKRLDAHSNREVNVHYHHTVGVKKPSASVRLEQAQERPGS